MTWKPLMFFAVALAGWMNRQQQEVIEYLTVENRILREKLGHLDPLAPLAGRAAVRQLRPPRQAGAQAREG